MSIETGLKWGPLSPRTAHVCVDMQGIFARDTPWAMPWFDRVLPVVAEVVRRRPERTYFTRFVPARSSGDGRGAWKRYYVRWSEMTLERLPPAAVDVVPELVALAPLAPRIDKGVYSPWLGPDLQQALAERGIDTVVITGGETDVCVLATVLGAVDLGFRTVLVSDAICSSADATHDALLTVYTSRFGQQLEVVTAAQLFDSGW